jgi:hypothetical protein
MKYFIALIAAAIVALPCAARAADVFVQAESFVNSHNVEPEEIRGEGGVLLGLDSPGEWAEFQVVVPTFGTYAVTMRCWGAVNVPYHFRIAMLPVHGEDDPETIDVSFTGKGNCGL